MRRSINTMLLPSGVVLMPRPRHRRVISTDLAATAKLLERGSTRPASTVRKPRGKKNAGS
jgi:hypothetical protein